MKKNSRSTAPSRPVEKFHTHRPDSSYLANYIFHIFYRPVPSWFGFRPNMSKPTRPVPSRIFQAMEIFTGLLLAFAF